MKVYLFSDCLKTIHGDPLQDSQSICEISNIDVFPDSLVRVKGRLARVCMIANSEGCIYIEFMGSMLKKDEISFSENITCPHCGSEDSDSWEADDNDDEHECEDCHSVFSYERNVDVTYSSKIIERNEKVVTLR